MQRSYFTSGIKILAIVICGLFASLSLADTLHGRVVAVADGEGLVLIDLEVVTT